MLATTALASSSSNVPILNNLSLLICHLFIGGHFRIGHILYDPKVFDDQIQAQIDSVCPVNIPWLTTDITQSTTLPFLEPRTDHILQLVFFDPEYFAEQINEFKDYLTFFRIFAFSSTIGGIDEKQLSAIRKMNSIHGTSSLLVEHDRKTYSTNVHLVSEHGEKHLTQTDNNIERIFDKIFGEYERTESIVIKALVFNHRKNGSLMKNLHGAYLANYFLTTFNASYVNLTVNEFSSRNTTPTNQVCTHKHKKYDNSLDYEPVDSQNLETLEGDRVFNTFHFDSTSLQFSNTDKGTMTHSLYPYHAEKLAIIFFYGTDFTRQTNIAIIPKSAQICAGLIGAFVGLRSIVLYVLRRKLNLPRNSISSSFIDTMIAYIAGGNIRVQHRFERWFFGIMLISAFFLVSVFVGDFLACVYRVWTQKFSTIEQLAAINPRIYVSFALTMHYNRVEAMARNKLGSNIILADASLESELIFQLTHSFAFIIEEKFVRNYRSASKAYNRDIDVLDECLGEISLNFFLRSDHYVPKQLIKKIDKATSSMMENGLYQFLNSFNLFKRSFIQRMYLLYNYEDEEDARVLTMEQLRRPMVLIFCLWGIAMIIWIAEMVISNWKKQQNPNPNPNPIPNPQRMRISTRVIHTANV